VCLFANVRLVLAAAVRLGIVGAYEAHRLQAECGPWLDEVLDRCGALTDDAVAQTMPIADILQARHDQLYSRLFQS